MFVILLTYTAPLERIDSLLEEHALFLRRKYDEGLFIASGRRVPRTGGVILALAADKDTLHRHLTEDPFHREGVARYEIIEFSPTMAASGFEALCQ